MIDADNLCIRTLYDVAVHNDQDECLAITYSVAGSDVPKAVYDLLASNGLINEPWPFYMVSVVLAHKDTE